MYLTPLIQICTRQVDTSSSSSSDAFHSGSFVTFAFRQMARVLPRGDDMVCLYDVTTRRQDMCSLSPLNDPAVAVARYPQLSSTPARV